MDKKPYGYTKGSDFLKAIGTFWSVIFKDNLLVKNYVEGMDDLLSQEYFNFLETIMKKSIEDIPVFHKSKWTLLTIKKSELNDEALFNYGDEIVYGPQPVGSEFGSGYEILYGSGVDGFYGCYALPDSITDVDCYITNKVIAPDEVLVKGTDFITKNGVICFKEDIFNNAYFSKRYILDSTGAPSDEELALWLLNSKEDYEYLWKEYGSIVDLYFKSSDNYKVILNAFWDLFMKGPRVQILVSIINLLLQQPVALVDDETVTEITSNLTTTTVVTDYNIYEVGLGKLSSSISEGTVLTLYQPISNIVKYKDYASSKQWWQNKELLTIPINLLNENYFSDLKIYKEDIKVTNLAGSTFEIKVEGDMTDEQKLKWKQIPLVAGLPGFVAGSVSFYVNSISVVMDLFYKYNIIYIEIDLTGLEYFGITSKTLELINSAIPANVYLLGQLNYEIDDDYDLTGCATTVEAKHGKALSDSLASTVNLIEGYHGYETPILVMDDTPKVISRYKTKGRFNV